jgi:hypothetical protein
MAKKHLNDTPIQTQGCEREQITIGGSGGKRCTQARKIMVLAVQELNGKLVITPIDVEHEEDNQTALSDEQERTRKAAHDALLVEQPAMEQALGHLYELFTDQLYRGSFRTFENFCFALYGMNRIPDDKQTKVRNEVQRLMGANNQLQEAA